MGTSWFAKRIPSSLVIILLLITLLPNLCLGARKLTVLYYEPPPLPMSYHNGALLEGELHVSILWYGHFSAPQKSTISDFLLSLNLPLGTHHSSAAQKPSVSEWWTLVQIYVKKAGKKEANVVLSNQISDENCSLGKILKRDQIIELANKVVVNSKAPGDLTLVLTANDVAVEDFCMGSCGFHASTPKPNSAFIWVGNSVTQCPGYCAWPFHQPIYGPQTAPLGAPNGDVGVDGMIVNIASLLAGTVTNPSGEGYYQGSAGSPLEAASACPGVYGKGAYPGYAGKLLVDSSSGGSYNALGVNGRKYLLPALFDPWTSQCLTLV